MKIAAFPTAQVRWTARKPLVTLRKDYVREYKGNRNCTKLCRCNYLKTLDLTASFLIKKGLVLLQALEESADRALLSPFCDDSVTSLHKGKSFESISNCQKNRKSIHVALLILSLVF